EAARRAGDRGAARGARGRGARARAADPVRAARDRERGAGARARPARPAGQDAPALADADAAPQPPRRPGDRAARPTAARPLAARCENCPPVLGCKTALRRESAPGRLLVVVGQEAEEESTMT